MNCYPLIGYQLIRYSYQEKFKRFYNNDSPYDILSWRSSAFFTSQR
jgi:hypothetical protein